MEPERMATARDARGVPDQRLETITLTEVIIPLEEVVREGRASKRAASRATARLCRREGENKERAAGRSVCGYAGSSWQ
jgi:hypothetical protein